MRNKKNEREEEKRSFKSRVIMFFLNVFLGLVGCVGLYVLFVFLQMPSLDSILHETREPAIIFLDKNGNEIRSMGRIMGNPVSVDRQHACGSIEEYGQMLREAVYGLDQRSSARS